jgi:hypothetical protein
LVGIHVGVWLKGALVKVAPLELPGNMRSKFPWSIIQENIMKFYLVTRSLWQKAMPKSNSKDEVFFYHRVSIPGNFAAHISGSLAGINFVEILALTTVLATMFLIIYMLF